jgi:hypothetical protein
MKQITAYITVLEAIGMLGNRSAIHNKLNKVHAGTDDAVLRDLLSDLIHQFHTSSAHTSHTTVEQMSACKATAAKSASGARPGAIASAQLVRSIKFELHS